MAAPIVYQGTNGKYEGTLFGGIKFWVAQRVPTRQEIVAKIKDNGGKIVPLEKNADVLIADHARKDAPRGSASWKYINDCVREGKLLNIDEYRIGSKQPTLKPTSKPTSNPTSTPTKATRAPFTKEDDQILAAWVRRNRHRASGNQIYKDLEHEYPHHTWHSWRNRYVKQLAFLSERDLDALAQLAPLPERDSTAPNHTPPTPLSRPVPRVAPAAATSVAGAQQTGSSVGQARGQAQRSDHARRRVFFTEEDDKLLTACVMKYSRAHESERGKAIYEALAEEYPHHTYHSWRDRWVRHLSLRNPQDLPDIADLEESTPVGPPSAYRDRSEFARAIVKSLKRGAMFGEVSTSRSTPSLSIEARSIVQELELKRRRIHAARTIQRVWRGYLTRRALAEQAGDDINGGPGDPPSVVTDGRQNDTDGFSRPDQLAAENDSIPVLGREEFWEYFNFDRETTGASCVPWAQIGRHTTDFWTLWSCATSQNPRHESRDWQVIAERLGYDWVAEPDVPRLLKEAYEKHLLEIELAVQDARQEFDDWGEDEEEEGDDEGLSREAGEGSDQEDAAPHMPRGVPVRSDGPDDFVSSPPVVGIKRTAEQAFESSFMGYASSVSKRRRHDPDEEIPDTPDSRLGLGGQEIERSSMPSASQDTPSKRPRRGPSSHERRGESESQGFQVSTPRRPGRLSEPSGLALQDDGLDNDDESFSPSEQLRSEMDEALSKAPSSANRPLPSIEKDDDVPSELSESSDEFETMGTPTPGVSRAALHPVLPNATRPRRALPAAWSKCKQPASAASISPPPPRRPVVIKETLSSSAAAAPRAPASNFSKGTSPSLTPRPPAYTGSAEPQRSSSSAIAGTNPNPKTAKQVIDPLKMVDRFVSLGYPQRAVARAVRATGCIEANTGAVIESLVRGHGIPRDLKGVWTDGDDERLRTIGRWLDALGGRVPKRPSADSSHEDRVFWGLAGKHGVEGVLQRRTFLKGWDSV